MGKNLSGEDSREMKRNLQSAAKLVNARSEMIRLIAQ
jgi:hypothetical protein